MLIFIDIGNLVLFLMDVLEKQGKDTYEIKNGIEWNRGYVDPFLGKDEEKNEKNYLWI